MSEEIKEPLSPSPENEQNTRLDALNLQEQGSEANDENTANIEDETSPAQENISLKKPRVWEIDFLRGFCVYLMILDHLAILIAGWFAPTWYGLDVAAYDSFSRFCLFWATESLARKILHPLAVFVFFSISGICCSFSRSNLKRGGILAFVALMYSLVTYGVQTLVFDDVSVFHPGSVFVSFGVLHFLAVCILIYAILQLATRKTKWQKWIIMGVSAAIIVVVLCLYFCYTPPENTPKFLGIIFPPKDIRGNFTAFYDQADISPGDLFSIIPYAAFFFAGTLVAPLVYPSRRSLLKKLDGKWHTPFTFVGRYAIFFYLAHVVVLAGILEIVTYALTGTWGI